MGHCPHFGRGRS
ncbi:hypothetical protein GBAR_LOCUS9405 [Geodia barretti]|uniref:Uncharacterized protein n=1 Tax=Geodia barretti TaxID=519541 RepID=A0AA35RQ02_GEOBA|nr:hypothetical protein GBAR_LOCUS9405 [Geodia barretti]